MNSPMKTSRQMIALVALMTAFLSCTGFSQTQANPPAEPEISREVGTLTSITGSVLVMKGDKGQEIKAVLQEHARIVRIAPGERDLNNAVPMALQELQPGDRILLVVKPASKDSFLALSLVAIKQSDVTQKQAKEKEDWQKRGVGGIVKSMNTATGDITIAITPSYSVAVKTSKATVFHRYAPDSVRFSDALPASFDQVHIGDQLRARGTRSADQKELVAEEVISGFFRNIAGTVVSVDEANELITVKDAIAKKTIRVKITADSRIQKLSPLMAATIASLLKASHSATENVASGEKNRPGADSVAAPPDVQQMVSRAPGVKLADLQKDNAVIIVSTPGDGKEGLTAVTVLSGVERILTAAPPAALLAEWNLNTALNSPAQ